MAQTKIHTVFHAMDAKGVFDLNPANPQSRDPGDGSSLYRGPQKYPRMFYHPEGLEEVTKEGEEIEKPGGRVMLVNHHTRLISRTARDAEEEKELRAEGWHDHPAKAIAASGRTPPPMSADSKIKSLEEELALLEDQKMQFQVEKESAAGELERLRAENAALAAKLAAGGAPLAATPKAGRQPNPLLDRTE